MKAIVAMSENRGIGIKGKIPWYVPEDFKWFKEFTLDQTIVVGRTTFSTLPLLKRRQCLVLSNQESYGKNISITNSNGFVGKIVSPGSVQTTDYIVAGGAKTYESLMPYITEFYVTRICGVYDADVFMLNFEHLFSNQEIVKEFDGHKVIKYIR